MTFEHDEDQKNHYFGRLRTVATSIGVAAVDFVKRLEKDVDEKFFPKQEPSPQDAAGDVPQQRDVDEAEARRLEDSFVNRKRAQSSKLLSSLVDESLKEVEAALRGLCDPSVSFDDATMGGGDAVDEHGAGAKFDVRWPLGEPDILADAAAHAARCRRALAQLRGSERGILRAEIDDLLALVNAAEDPASKSAAATIDQLERLCGRASGVEFEDAVTAFVRVRGVELLRARSRVAVPIDKLALVDEEDNPTERGSAITTKTASALLRCVRLAQIGRAADAAKAAVDDVVSVQLLCLRRWANLAAQPGSGGGLRGEVPSDALLKHALEQSAGAPLVVATSLVRAGCALQAEMAKDKTAQAVSEMQDAANRRGGVEKSGARSNAHQRVARLAAALCGWAPDATRALIRSDVIDSASNR